MNQNANPTTPETNEDDYNRQPRNWHEAPQEDKETAHGLVTRNQLDELHDLVSEEPNYWGPLVAAEGVTPNTFRELVLRLYRKRQPMGYARWSEFLDPKHEALLDLVISDSGDENPRDAYVRFLLPLIEEDPEAALSHIAHLLTYRAERSDTKHVWQEREWDQHLFTGMVPWLDFVAREQIRDAVLRDLGRADARLVLCWFSYTQQLSLFFRREGQRSLESTGGGSLVLAVALLLQYGMSEAACKAVYAQRPQKADTHAYDTWTQSLTDASQRRDKFSKRLVEFVLSQVEGQHGKMYAFLQQSADRLLEGLGVPAFRDSWVDIEIRTAVEARTKPRRR